MTTLAIAWSPERQAIDLCQRPADRLSWLENAVTISLFTDARAEETDLLPEDSDRRGHWADIWLDEGQSLGSKLWLLRREKVTPDVLRRCRDYAQEALDWLVDDDHLQAVRVSAIRNGLNLIAFEINCQLPDGSWIPLFREHQHAI